MLCLATSSTYSCALQVTTPPISKRNRTGHCVNWRRKRHGWMMACLLVTNGRKELSASVPAPHKHSARREVHKEASGWREFGPAGACRIV